MSIKDNMQRLWHRGIFFKYLFLLLFSQLLLSCTSAKPTVRNTKSTASVPAFPSPGITWSANPQHPLFINSSGGSEPFRFSVSGLGSISNRFFIPSGLRSSDSVYLTDSRSRSANLNVHTLPSRVDGQVYAQAQAGDGTYFLGGDFLYVGGYPAPNLAFLDLTTGAYSGTCNFQDGFDGPVLAAKNFDAGYFVAGAFTKYQGVDVGGLVRLDLDCNLDLAFNANLGSGFKGTYSGGVWPIANVHALAFDSERNSLYVGGDFTSFRSASLVSSHQRYLLKLNASTGLVDSSFPGASLSGLNGKVTALEVSSGKLYVGGYFTSFDSLAFTGHLIQVELSSGLVSSFSSVNPDGPVLALQAWSDGLFVGGTFTAPTNYFAKYNYNGTVAAGFSTSFISVGSEVRAIASSASAVYLGGVFTEYAATSVRNLVKIDPVNGTMDVGFATQTFNGAIHSLLLMAESLYIGGQFTEVSLGANNALGIAKLHSATGILDGSFNQVNSGLSHSGAADKLPRAYSLMQTRHGLFVGGSFVQYRGSYSPGLVKFTSTGSIDTAFSVGTGFYDSTASWSVRSLLLNQDHLYVGGSFEKYQDLAARRIAKLSATTAAPISGFDKSWLVESSGAIVSSLALSSDGLTLFLGGTFTLIRSTNVGNLAAINATTGVLSAAFPSGTASQPFNGPVSVLKIDGSSLFVGGSFTNYNRTSPAVVSQLVNGLARLSASDGSLENGLGQFHDLVSGSNGFPGGSVAALDFVGSSGLLVGGSFSSYQWQAGSQSLGLGNFVQLHRETGIPNSSLASVTQFQTASGAVAGVTIRGILNRTEGVYVSGNFGKIVDGASEVSEVSSLVVVQESNGKLLKSFGHPSGSAGAPITSFGLASAASGDIIYLGNSQSFNGYYSPYVKILPVLSGLPK